MTSVAVQCQRIEGINAIVDATLASHPSHTVLWASGGDGGHVVFRKGEWQQAAVKLFEDLRKWARDHQVPLRVIGHYGAINIVRGVADALQPVGDAINMAGWILARGSDEGVVVSAEFAEQVRLAGLTDADADKSVRVHDPRKVLLKGSREQNLFLISSPDLSSRWPDPDLIDRTHLRRAVAEQRVWDTIYHAKRVLQVNRADEDAERALGSLDDVAFDFVEGGRRRKNPFLSGLDRWSRGEVIKSGQLIERRYNEAICRYGDKGNTMFLILRGQVGVSGSEGHRIEGAPPAWIHKAGEVVGELAFALNRSRTADLTALGDVALLSFNFDDITKAVAIAGPAGAEALNDIWRFITGRVLEHVATNVPYLVGLDRKGPLSMSVIGWQAELERMGSHCHMASKERDQRISLRSDLRTDAVYVLAAGVVERQGGLPERLLGHKFPLLQVNLSDVLMGPNADYLVVEGPVRMLCISRSAVSNLPSDLHLGVVQELRRSLSSMVKSAEGRQARRAANDVESRPITHVHHTYLIQGDVSQLNIGDRQTVHSIQRNLNMVRATGDPRLVDALRLLSDAAIEDTALDDGRRAQVLDAIEEVSEEARTAVATRRLPRAMRAIGYISTVAGAATALGTVWRQYGQVVIDHFQGLPHP